MRRRALTLALSLAVGAVPASAQERRCDGRDPETAARERQRARDAFDRATRRPGYVDLEALSVAIAAATASCAAGEDRGLALRATALHTRGDHVSAARDLDAYLARHPLAMETDNRVREFLHGLAEGIDRAIARVHIDTPREGLEDVRLGDVVVDDRSAWVPTSPGVVRVEVRGPEFEDARTELRIEAGTRVRLTVREGVDPGSVTPSLALRRRARAPILPTRGAHPIRPWAIASTVAAGGVLAAGIGLLAWRESAASAYGALGCESMPLASAACVERYSRFSDANGAAIGTLVTAGVLAIASGVLWYLDLRPRSSRAWRCAPSLGGVACAVRF